MTGFRTSPSYKEVLASQAASVATRTSDPIDCRHAKALLITTILANKAGTVTFTPKIQRLLKDGTTWVDYWTAAAALSANGTAAYGLGEHLSATLGGLVEVKETPLPSYCRLVLTYSGAGGANNFDTYAEVEMFPR